MTLYDHLYVMPRICLLLLCSLKLFSFVDKTTTINPYTCSEEEVKENTYTTDSVWCRLHSRLFWITVQVKSLATGELQ